MAQPAIKPLIPVEEYLLGERDGEQRYEFVNGEVFAMTGASRDHNLVAGNIFAFLHGRLPDACRIFMNDMKVRCRMADDERYYYPDVVLACEENESDPYYCENPCLIVEVLSPGTERTDRSEKFFAYRHIPSLMEYVLIVQDSRRVEVYRRRTQWDLELYQGEAVVELECAQARIGLDAVYRHAEPDAQ